VSRYRTLKTAAFRSDITDIVKAAFQLFRGVRWA
jgi:hypothetical protein